MTLGLEGRSVIRNAVLLACLTCGAGSVSGLWAQCQSWVYTYDVMWRESGNGVQAHVESDLAGECPYHWQVAVEGWMYHENEQIDNGWSGWGGFGNWVSYTTPIAAPSDWGAGGGGASLCLLSSHVLQ